MHIIAVLLGGWYYFDPIVFLAGSENRPNAHLSTQVELHIRHLGSGHDIGHLRMPPGRYPRMARPTLPANSVSVFFPELRLLDGGGNSIGYAHP